MKIAFPAQNIAIQTPQNVIDATWYDRIKALQTAVNGLLDAVSRFTWVSGTVGVGSGIINSLSSDVSLTAVNIATYFNGPSIAQGTTGTWFVSGTVTLSDAGGAASFSAKLWDGTTVIATGFSASASTGFRQTISLSGFIASPAGNLRIDVSTNGTAGGSKILFNQSGSSKDSTISAIRIA